MKLIYKAARHSKEISNYLMYLMFVDPEMLMTGARHNLFRAMYNKLKRIPLYNEPGTLGEKELTQNIIHSLLGTKGSDMDRMVHDAWAIANELLTGLQLDEEKLWRLVQGVWVEIIGSERLDPSLRPNGACPLPASTVFRPREWARISPEAHQHNLGQGGGVTAARQRAWPWRRWREWGRGGKGRGRRGRGRVSPELSS